MKRRNFTFDSETLRLIAALSKITEIPSDSELIRQCVILLNEFHRCWKDGSSMIFRLDGQEDQILSSWRPIGRTPTSSRAFNKRRNLMMTPSINRIIDSIVAESFLKSDSDLLRYAVRLYYAVVSNRASNGKVLLRTAAGDEKELLILTQLIDAYGSEVR